MIHKVLQEGHPNTLKDGYRNRDFIASLATVFPSHGSAYGRLINQYDKYILQKLISIVIILVLMGHLNMKNISH